MTRLRTAVFTMLAVTACERPAPTTSESPRPSPARAAPSDAKAEPARTTTTTTRTGDGRCDPMPKVGTPCSEGDSYCVESWGVPGGSSSALWCREGKWEREEERNLPADEGAP